MKKYFVLVLFTAIITIAADFLGEVPAWLIGALVTVVIPGIVALVKAVTEKWPNQLGWLNGKFWLSVVTYILAIVATAAFANWKLIPALPVDPGEAVLLVIGYVQMFFGGATGLYNVLISPVHKLVG